MNTVNQIFDWSRFTATLRKEVVENWRPIVFTLLAVYGLLTMVMIIGNAISFDDAVSDAMSETMVPQKVVYGILGFSVMIVASMAFKKLTTKAGRIDMMTSPSSTLEKFLVNGVVYVLGFVVAFLILAQLADLTRIAVMHIFGFQGFIPGVINFTNLGSDFIFGLGSSLFNGPMAVTYAWCSLLATSGIYLLGSVMWPRLSLLKTFAAIYAVEFVLGVLGVIFIFVFSDMESFGMWVIEHRDGFMPLMMTFMVIQLILGWGLAWYLFKRKDVISLKWWQ
jgi:hypothetical protein